MPFDRGNSPSVPRSRASWTRERAFLWQRDSPGDHLIGGRLRILRSLQDSFGGSPVSNYFVFRRLIIRQYPRIGATYRFGRGRRRSLIGFDK
jgi:hypothetical protein